jgi:hypothetical protein
VIEPPINGFPLVFTEAVVANDAVPCSEPVIPADTLSDPVICVLPLTLAVPFTSRRKPASVVVPMSRLPLECNCILELPLPRKSIARPVVPLNKSILPLLVNPPYNFKGSPVENTAGVFKDVPTLAVPFTSKRKPASVVVPIAKFPLLNNIAFVELLLINQIPVPPTFATSQALVPTVKVKIELPDALYIFIKEDVDPPDDAGVLVPTPNLEFVLSQNKLADPIIAPADPLVNRTDPVANPDKLTGDVVEIEPDTESDPVISEFP